MIPVSRPHLGPEELAAVQKVFGSRWLGMGAVTKSFEDAVSDFLGGDPRSQVVAVNTGTAALHLALEATGLGPGDEVIVPSLTFAATIQTITALGVKPVFCDVEEDTLNLDLRDALKCQSSKTKAILPIHYRSHPCDMKKLMDLARDHRWRPVEDAAHAFGSSYQDRRIGAFGDLTCFSFDPIKNITCGEGGAITTRDAELAERLRRKRILGIDKDTWSRYRNERLWFYDVTEQGFRYHMSNINAAIGLVQLKKFSAMNMRKIEIAKRYAAAFGLLPKLRLLKTDYEHTALFTYILRVLKGEREALMPFLKQQGVDSGIHYIPAHHFTYFKRFATRPLPATERLYDEILTLPLFSEMTDAEVEKVIQAVRQWAGRS